MFDVELVPVAMSVVWDAAVGTLVGLVVVIVLGGWLWLRWRQRVQVREIIRRRLAAPGRNTPQPELGTPHGVCGACEGREVGMVNNYRRCARCDQIHPECVMMGCHNPTHCSSDEQGEPFVYCDACDAALSEIGRVDEGPE